MLPTDAMRRGTLTVTAIPELKVLASEEGMVQVLHNLLVNAVEAWPRDRAQGNELRLSAGRDDGRVWIEVRDNGEGIKAENLPKVFDPFFTTKPIGSGTGLGLCICHGIVSKLGGELSVQSGPQGTTFRVQVRDASSALARAA
jgi:C4-dicarboxylate-specific signal transduction histidine kinase